MIFTSQLLSAHKFQNKPIQVQNPTSRPWWKTRQATIAAWVACSLIVMSAGLSILLTTCAEPAVAYAATVFLPVLSLISAILVPLLSNPMHCLISLLALFVSTAIMYLVQGAEYLAFVFLIVYVGAVAILFLFVIMLINVKNLVVRAIDNALAYRVAGGFVALTVFYSIERFLYDTICSFPDGSVAVFRMIVATDVINFSALYTDHWPLFALLTMILLIAMLGAIIVGTVTDAPDSKKDR